MRRRDFIMSGAAFGGLSAGTAMAHTAEPFVMPDDYLPTVVDMDYALPAGEIHVFPEIFRLFLTCPINAPSATRSVSAARGYIMTEVSLLAQNANGQAGHQRLT